ncbi:MAG: hypothetical protein AB7F96_19615 [Beijerinckiaceae bacterium]
MRLIFRLPLSVLTMGVFAAAGASAALAQQRLDNRSNFEIIQPNYNITPPQPQPNYPQPERMPMPPVVVPPRQDDPAPRRPHPWPR